MKVQATKVMAAALSEAIKETGKNWSFSLVKLSERAYNLNVGSSIYPEIDFDWNTEKFKVILLSYSPNDYAMPAYITTPDLVKICRSYACKSVNDLAAAIADKYGI